MKQALDFRDESRALHALLQPLSDRDFALTTRFKAWSLDAIVAHLHFYNLMADLTLKDEAQFHEKMARVKALRAGGETMVSSADIMLDGLSGRALLDAWRAGFERIAEDWSTVDPRRRLSWVGPSMSARSSISARLMETWAHGQAIYDLMAVERQNTDRIDNIVVMGVNTFGWTFSNRGLPVPAQPPALRLTAPSGALWTYNDPLADSSIEGSASEFCQVVTQVRNIADTRLVVRGETATRWMAIAQCFAGPPNDPPASGSRVREAVAPQLS
jgi:uncharacterized protein (TIGR03084 family)